MGVVELLGQPELQEEMEEFQVVEEVAVKVLVTEVK